MSDPARTFKSLDLDGMPITRSQNRTQQHQRGEMSLRGRGQGRALSSLPPVGLTRARSGIRYDTQVYSPTTSQRAVEGLQSDSVVDYVHRYASGPDRYLVFQVRQPVDVRIHDPTGEAGEIYECSCDAFRNTQSPCRHIFRVFAGLHGLLINRLEAVARRPTQIELAAQFGEMYPLIEQEYPFDEKKGDSERLKGELNRMVLVDPDDLDANLDEFILPESSAVGGSGARKDTLCDILASFSEKTPGEVNAEFVENDSNPTSDEVLVENNLPATIYRLAMQNDTLYRQLLQIVPIDVRARQYYETLYLRAQDAIERLSDYARDGPRNPRRDLTVPECATVLRKLVHQICEDRDKRTAVSPLGAVVASRLAEILVGLIDRVKSFNQDIYARARWNRVPTPNEHPRDRNLFAYLIGNPPHPWSLDWKTDYFVIDRLRGCPLNEWRHLSEQLTTIKRFMERLDTRVFPMVSQYARQIDEMLSF